MIKSKKLLTTLQLIIDKNLLPRMIGDQILEPGTVDSTNLYANLLLKRTKPEEGTVIRADYQTHGKGQGENAWISEPGKNLTFTIILYPEFLRADQQFSLNQAISLGILDYIRLKLQVISRLPGNLQPGEIPSTSIKWPNDIYINELKIGGILIEHRIAGAVLDTSLIGIGLNINQEDFQHFLPNPVSLKNIIHEESDLKTELKQLCHFLDARYKELKNNNPDDLKFEFSRNLLGYQVWREYETNQGLITGKITGVNKLGQLILEADDKRKLIFSHHEIKYILKPAEKNP